MAKKGLLVLVLASVLAGGVWAQDAADAAWDGKKNFVTTDLGLVFSVFSLPIGVRYERLLTPNISVGADFYWGYMIAVVTEFDVGVFARYYLWKDLFGELGLNLTAASRVIHYDLWYNPAVENQATDRAFRIGQMRNSRRCLRGRAGKQLAVLQGKMI